MKASFLICCFFLCVYTHVCIRNIGKIWFGYTSSEMTSYFEISFRSFLWKKETTNCYSCSSPSWWKQKWYWWWWSQIRGINQKQNQRGSNRKWDRGGYWWKQFMWKWRRWGQRQCNKRKETERKSEGQKSVFVMVKGNETGKFRKFLCK